MSLARTVTSSDRLNWPARTCPSTAAWIATLIMLAVPNSSPAFQVRLSPLSSWRAASPTAPEARPATPATAVRAASAVSPCKAASPFTAAPLAR
jgi:hypothetical protein